MEQGSKQDAGNGLSTNGPTVEPENKKAKKFYLLVRLQGGKEEEVQSVFREICVQTKLAGLAQPGRKQSGHCHTNHL